MSAATDALNKAIDDLSTASHAMLDRIAEESARIDEKLKDDDTPEVDAATARIRDMAQQLKDKLGALSTSAAAANEQPATASVGIPGVDAGANHTELAGVPATPGGVAAVGTGAAVPSTDFVVTETSPNQETSGPAAEPGAEQAAVPGATAPAEVGSSAQAADATGPVETQADASTKAESPQ